MLIVAIIVVVVPQLVLLPLVHRPKRPLPDLVAADHDSAGRRHLERPGDPPAKETGRPLGGENVPQQSQNRLLLGGQRNSRLPGQRRGGRVPEDLHSRLADIKGGRDERGERARKSSSRKAIHHRRYVIFPAL